VALESILKVLIEAVLAPFSNSHFIERIESSTAKLGMHDLFNEYLKVAKLDKADRAGTTERLKLFEAIWDEISFTTRRGTEEMESSHFKVRTKLNYYLNPVFLHGAKIRACSLIDSEKMAEASHYLKSTLLDIVENYVWFRSSTNKTATDCTILMRSLESLEKKNPENYRKMALLLDLHDIEKNDVPDAIEKTREIMLRIRRDRKVLIKSQSTKSQPRT
jgi:hypothetical protein